MIVNKLETVCFINKIKEHKNIKQSILNLIKTIPLNNYKTDRETISHTDWNLPKNHKREYLDFFYKIISPYMDKIMNKLYCTDWKIRNAWFQQYEKNNEHNWHNHNEANYTNVYYLEMPDDNMKTELYDILNKKIITFDLKEGDLFTFPANILHRSKKINIDKRKTIISFNSDFEKVNL
jgi:hypothetical protein